MQKSQIHIYTGNGKGKTTAAIGLAIRALGAGWNVLFLQFMKDMRYSEIALLESLGKRITVKQFGHGCILERSPDEADFQAAQQGLSYAQDALVRGLYQLVVLDEINIALHNRLLETRDVLSILNRRAFSCEVVLTGRYAPSEILAAADLVTEMQCVRHYYNKGVEARVGVER
ncbi:MAG TPA: cob(I)yrinic acid a,c-diamide adenosyltransferase [Fibrobacteraceae bacterium]|nr:cob(I)yrinic acid a,c-diamide adenosyltransferase [Fibrobacteraceae bacterium]